MSRTLTKQGEGLVLPWLLVSCRYLHVQCILIVQTIRIDQEKLQILLIFPAVTYLGVVTYFKIQTNMMSPRQFQFPTDTHTSNRNEKISSN